MASQVPGATGFVDIVSWILFSKPGRPGLLRSISQMREQGLAPGPSQTWEPEATL